MTTNNDEFDSHEEFMRCFLECQRGLLRYVMCFVPNAHDARDIVQNTAIALWKKHEQYDLTESFMPWACRFALNETRLFMRTDQRWKHFLDEETVNVLAGRRQEIGGSLMKDGFICVSACVSCPKFSDASWKGTTSMMFRWNAWPSRHSGVLRRSTSRCSEFDRR